MSEEKRKRVLSATLSGLIMLFTVLLAIIAYQLIGISVRKQKIAELDAEISALRQDIENTEDEIESWSFEWKIEKRARELGMYRPDEE
ncbi:MAG: septum formation initiator family protein [Clostridia bacterium]|nr:septum formation initiator family protein [Clostridia bacterium]